MRSAGSPGGRAHWWLGNMSRDQYYKFSLDHINLYNLIRLEEDGAPRTAYLSAFATLRACTGTHENAHFNMIERGVEGADAARDRETEKCLKGGSGGRDAITMLTSLGSIPRAARIAPAASSASTSA